MSNYVADSAGGRAVSAYVILKGSKYVAKVQISHGRGGAVLVNIFQTGEAAQRSAKALKKPYPAAEASDMLGFQHGRAGGYGYDKTTAALSRLIVDGHILSDHCGGKLKPPKGHTGWPTNAKPPRGYRFANVMKNDADEWEYRDCYRISGLGYLEAVGYTVIQAI